MFVSTEFYHASEHRQDHVQHYELNTHQDWVQFFLNNEINKQIKIRYARDYLSACLNDTTVDHLSWLNTPEQAKDYLALDHHATCEKFQAYLQRRKQHGMREYFPTVSHAFEFIYRVAPVKLVDGSWLYSTLEHYEQPLARDLIHIYLEELGLGHPKANHVTMYQDLLHTYELSSYTSQLEDDYYQQAAVQLALAYAPPEYLAMVVGFNLGYEQLPLHLLITNYELAELNIDPHYFNVHITIDNAHNGHAQKSLNAYAELYKQAHDPEHFLHLLKVGYALNDVGKSSTQIIQELDLKHEVLNIFKQKAVIGQFIHNQKCQLQGKSINEWLSEPESMEQFLAVMIEKGWIVPKQAVTESRFWHMIDDPDGRMFGVFNATERQMIKDWIQGPELAQRLALRPQHISSIGGQNDADLQRLKKRYQQLKTEAQKMQFLIPLTAPHSHSDVLGLWATAQMSKLLFPFQTQALKI
ncbi:hypothetical protein A3K93_03965 [Acinetobacter sp. NCu2D-2]|uniref:iron-containing redox enzyme family protein n=1 Tax=Acinetobacter sp. NCu2D-2 TaxID=1608473 RepID=UPI0007CDCEAB|nr:iron-containing redox enzyme family protein [Acinetobacter sp. NCu2D-2]ANF81433.1 hypothetical protein A3K93_03965 [Acinetobacter sp. NCu2D-2]